MPDPKRFQVVVVGTGPGGYVAAIRAAQLGLKTAVVEREELGGTCLNWGCIPTKAWIVTAHLYEQIQRAREYGIEVSEPKIRWEWLVERKNKVVKQLTGGVKILLNGRQVEIFHGHARLVTANRMHVASEGAASAELAADHVILATGAERHHASGHDARRRARDHLKEALDLTHQPKRLAVLGGGVVGSEFACFFAAIGTKVTLIEMLPRLVPAEDDDIAQTLEREMKKQEIDLHLDSKVERPDQELRRLGRRSRSRAARRSTSTPCWSRPAAGRTRAISGSNRSASRAAIAARSWSTIGSRPRSRASTRSATSPTSSSSPTSRPRRARRRPR